MKKLFRRLGIFLLVIVILAVAVVIVVHLFADRAVKIGIETAATKTLNVEVTIGDVDLSIIGGKLRLQNLVIKNPPGYQHDKLLELRNAKIEVDVRSLLGDVVNIREIKLDGMNVVLEQRGVFSNNLQDVIRAIPAKDKQVSEPSGKKLHIDNLEITNTKVKVKLLPIPGKADTVTLNLAPIRMTDLGGDNKLNTAGLSSKVLLAVAKGIAEQGTGVLPEDMVASLTSELQRLGALPGALLEGGGKILEAGTDLGKKAIEAGKDIGDAATDALKGLFKPKKEQ